MPKCPASVGTGVFRELSQQWLVEETMTKRPRHEFSAQETNGHALDQKFTQSE
jgi:hypothetical protein